MSNTRSGARLIPALVVSLLCLNPSETRAEALVFASASALGGISLSVCGEDARFETETNTGNAAHSTAQARSSCRAGDLGSGTGSALGDAAAAGPRASASASAITTANIGLLSELVSQAGAEARASVSELFTVTGAGRFGFSFSFTASAGLSDCDFGGAGASGKGQFSKAGVQLFFQSGTIQACVGSEHIRLIATDVLDLPLGDYEYSAEVGAGAGSTSHAPLATSHSAFGSAGNTLYFYVTPLSPGASYVTASGLDYSRPVPEPKILTLLVAGASVASRRLRAKLVRNS